MRSGRTAPSSRRADDRRRRRALARARPHCEPACSSPFASDEFEASAPSATRSATRPPLRADRTLGYQTSVSKRRSTFRNRPLHRLLHHPIQPACSTIFFSFFQSTEQYFYSLLIYRLVSCAQFPAKSRLEQPAFHTFHKSSFFWKKREFLLIPAELGAGFPNHRSLPVVFRRTTL